MTVQTSTKTILRVVAGVPATEDEAGYTTLFAAGAEVGELTDFPEYGPTYDVVTHEPLKTGRKEKYKGFKDNGSASLTVGRDIADAGQAILRDATDGSNEFGEVSFENTFQDGSVEYFYGSVFSYTTNVGAANSIVGAAVQVEVNSNILQVSAP